MHGCMAAYDDDQSNLVDWGRPMVYFSLVIICPLARAPVKRVCA